MIKGYQLLVQLAIVQIINNEPSEQWAAPKLST